VATEAHATTPRAERDGLAAALGSIAVLGVALLLAPFRDSIGLTNVALILTLVVVGAAAAGGRIAGATTAVIGALGFNAVHLRPYGTLRIDSPADMLTCALMVVVGVAVGQLSHMAAERGRLAVSSRSGIHDVSMIIELVADHAPAEVLVDRSADLLVGRLGLRSCRFARGDATVDGPDGAMEDLDRSGAIPGPLRHGNGGFQLPADGATLPVLGDDGTVIGRFVLEPTPGHGVARADRELAVLVASVIAPSLQASRPAQDRSGSTGSAERNPT